LTFLRDKKEFLVENYGVISIGLFGSYAIDKAREDCDINIAVEKIRQIIILDYTI